MDIISELLNVFGDSRDPHWVGVGFTGLFIAGGSSSINMLLEKLDFRNYDKRLAKIAQQESDKKNPQISAEKRAGSSLDELIKAVGILNQIEHKNENDDLLKALDLYKK